MIHKYMFIAKQLSPVLCCNSISLEEPSRYVDMLSHPYYGFAQLRATIMRIVFDPRNSSLSFQRNMQISIEQPGVKNCPNPRMFLTITFCHTVCRKFYCIFLTSMTSTFKRYIVYWEIRWYGFLTSATVGLLGGREIVSVYSYQL